MRVYAMWHVPQKNGIYGNILSPKGNFECRSTFSMTIGNGELIHEYFPKHSCMGTARLKEDKETD